MQINTLLQIRTNLVNLDVNQTRTHNNNNKSIHYILYKDGFFLSHQGSSFSSHFVISDPAR